MTLVEVKKGIVDLIKTIYPNHTFYTTATVEGYKRPSFFIQLKPSEMTPSNYNSRFNDMTIYIDYLQKTIDEVDALKTVQELQDLFGLAFPVGKRYIDVDGFDYDFVGSERNILELTIDISYHDIIKHPINAPNMESMELQNKNMEE